MLEPLADIVVIKPLKERPDHLCEGEVIAIGPEVKHVHVGDKVLYNTFGRIRLDNEEQNIVSEVYVYAVTERAVCEDPAIVTAVRKIMEVEKKDASK